MKRLALSLFIATLSQWSFAGIEISNAIALHGKPALPANFAAFNYANPQAPKGGELRLAAIGGFDSTNPFINKGNPIDGLSKESIVGGNRILVDEFCQVKNHHNIFAIGDVAAMIREELPKGHPMVAPVAIQQGDMVAKNIIAQLNGKTPKPFQYFDKGSMATVGRNKAVMESKGIKMGGFIAWLAWLFVHVMSLVGFRNKITVTLGWLYNYFTYDRTLRLIIRPFKNKEE